MANTNQGLPADASIGVEALVSLSKTAPPVTTPGDGDATAKPISEAHTSGMTPFSSSRLVDNGDDTIKACGDDDTTPGLHDQSRMLSKIKQLQDELFKIEKGARQRHNLEHLEKQWDNEFEQVGSDAEQRSWARIQGMKAQSFVKDTTAFAFGREWARESEDSFIRYMMEREDFDKQLMQRRAQWEAKRGITREKVDESPSAWPQDGSRLPLTLPGLFDPLSMEARFNETAMAQGYDSQERQLRSQVHEIVRSKYYAFMSWKENYHIASQPPKDPDPKLKDLWPRPVANYVQWESFRYGSPSRVFNTEEKQHLCALIVLEGEPDSSFASVRSASDLEKRAVQNNSKTLPRDIPRLAQGFVPERIRLNGPHFHETFMVLDSAPPGSFAAQSQMTLLQPYRLLIYHEQGIRNRFEALKEKLLIPSEPGTVYPEGFTQTSKHDDTGQDDTKQEVNTAPDTDMRPSEESGLSIESGYNDPDSTQHDKNDGPHQEPDDDTIDKNEYPFANSKTALNYLGCLIDFMDSTISIKKEHIQGTQCRKVHFRDLWYLFSPGDEVIRRDGRQVYKVIEVFNPAHRASSRNVFFDYDEKDTSRYFRLSCAHVDFDGKRIGPVSTTFVIKTFAGERNVESLEIYPLRLHRHTSTLASQGGQQSFPTSDAQTLRQALIKRGKKFFQAACMKLEHAFYDGPTMDGEEVESQVVVDFETALSSDQSFSGEEFVPQIRSLLDDTDDGDSTSSVSGEEIGLGCMGACCIGQQIYDDSFVDSKRKDEYINSLIPKTPGYAKLPSVVIYPRSLEETAGDNALTDDEFLVMSYRVFAFVLRTRKWAELDLTYMEDAAEDDIRAKEENTLSQPAFEQLVLPEGHKTIVMSLISQHFRNRDSGRHNVEYSDIVRGKGKGLILLLHGAPGVGKTSTAEGIAEMFKKPLFTITCGDLGSTAKEVERALDLNFNLANRWGCILLLDEADVFLASRTADDFERNGLVAVFLRVLEYYAGILFLTTNRVGVIDEAFRSRIHISLYYPPLGRDETQAVFALNLKLIEDRFRNEKRNINIARDGIIEFALEYFRTNQKARWNGRQIRNACQTALALAEFKAQGGSHDTVLNPNADVCLAVDNFKTVSKAYLEFTKYLKQLYGIYEDIRAEERGLRARENSRQPRVQSTQSPVFDANITEPGSYYGQTHSYNNAPVQPVHGQSYQTAPIMGPVHMNTTVSPPQQGQQIGYYGNPVQSTPAGNYGGSGQALSSQIAQQGQEYMGMQFQPAPGNINQQPQQWLGLASPPSSATLPRPPSTQTQQQYPHVQPIPGTTALGSQMPTSQPFQTQQSMAPQQLMQQQNQQQAPQTWYPSMSTQNMQPAGGQNPPGPSPQEGS